MILLNHLFDLKVLIEYHSIHQLHLFSFRVNDDDDDLSSYNQLYIHEFHMDEI
jgi:hypothetical protein